jgi:hypothetical protein
VAAEAPSSGVENQPAGTVTGDPDPAGQNTVASPHGTAMAVVEPAGQKNPAAHAPVHAALGSEVVAPNRPARGREVHSKSIALVVNTTAHHKHARGGEVAVKTAAAPKGPSTRCGTRCIA